MKLINKKELKYIVLSAVFAFLWFVLLLPNILPSIETSSPYFQFLIFNIGIYLFLFIFLKSLVTKTTFNLKSALGLSLLFIALDCALPEYHVTIAGQLVSGATLGASSSDYVIGLLGQQIGLTGFLVYLWAYLVVPAVILILSSLLIKDFVKEI